MHDHVDVVDEEETEDDSAPDGDDELQHVRVRDEDLKKTTDNEDHQTCIQTGYQS